MYKRQVYDWNTPATVTELGQAVSMITGQVLRQIERTIRQTERSMEPVSYTHLDVYKRQDKTIAWIALAALVGMGLAGGVLLIRSKKQSAARRTDNDFDLDEDDDDEHAQQE